MLRDAFDEVLRSGGRLLYCDTDSIYAAYPNNLEVENTTLGRHVAFAKDPSKPYIVDAVFIAPKTYGLLMSDGSEVLKTKGLDSSCIRFRDLKNGFYQTPHVLSVETQAIYRDNLTTKSIKQTRNIKLDSYDKRLWSHCKKFTEPKETDL